MRLHGVEVPTVLPASSESSLLSRTGDSFPVMHQYQVPPITKYLSGNSDSETFEDWHEQFELVAAAACGWNDPGGQQRDKFVDDI